VLVVRATVVGPFAENSYLVGCDRTGEAMLVDPGGENRRVLAMRHPGDFRVVRIVCTHGHVDHVAGAAQAQEETGAPLQIHESDQEWVEGVADQGAMFGFEELRAPTVHRFHEDGEVFAIGEHEAQILHTPGHSRGSCCILFPADEVVLTGDTLFSGSVGRTDLPGGDFGALERSIRDKLFALGDSVRFFPGHGQSGLIGDERRLNPFVGDARRSRFP